jgi:predicted RNA polymerase sigma factor
VDLAEEAIRLARALHAGLPDDAEVSGLLALMLLAHARHRARTVTFDGRPWDSAPSARLEVGA